MSTPAPPLLGGRTLSPREAGDLKKLAPFTTELFTCLAQDEKTKGVIWRELKEPHALLLPQANKMTQRISSVCEQC